MIKERREEGRRGGRKGCMEEGKEGDTRDSCICMLLVAYFKIVEWNHNAGNPSQTTRPPTKEND